ncbi:putative GTP-binding protein 6 [Onthophagus taurus]|uniref:putative GTP-binding protein 6 n=1 Tax=Onthophagus taurus TaxID=166361 RepID=UPI000C20E537|nr:putative GTP-binding protein 6 [Onthophagus taurus]
MLLYLLRLPRFNIKRLSRLSRFNSTSIQEFDQDDIIDKDYQALIEQYLPSNIVHRCFIIHPYVKWGPQKIKDVTLTGQLDEAIALVNSLQSWKVVDKISVPLESLDKKSIFGSGTIKKLQDTIKRNSSLTSIFINMEHLKTSQMEEMEKIFALPIFDRYNIVLQILRLHAISKHAKLQVAIAELPYIKSKLKKISSLGTDYDTRRLILKNREEKLKGAIKKLRSQRELLRNRRIKVSYPVVAVVGYTNAGKTSLIKSLTGDQKLQPKNQLFATLDVTLHNGVLPSKLEVLYVDTVGFLSQIPTGLIECFIATLEDALLADLILHVEDLSSPNFTHQRNHVLGTLKALSGKMGTGNILDKLISIGNKCDIEHNIDTKKIDDDYLKISTVKEIGIDALRELIEKLIIKNTNRHVITLNLPIGGDETRWLYKNCTVINVGVDENNSDHHNVKVIITSMLLNKFKRQFC